MPCEGGPGPCDKVNRELDKVTRLLCFATDQLSDSGFFNSLHGFDDSSIRVELSNWYMEHLIKDKQRKLREAANKKQTLSRWRKDIQNKQSQIAELEREIKELESA